MDINFVVEWFGSSGKTAKAAKLHGEKLSQVTISRWQRKGGVLPKALNDFFAKIILSESETGMKVALDALGSIKSKSESNNDDAGTN